MAKASYYVGKVYDFHKKFGHPANNELQKELEDDQIELRQSLILEEGMEIIKGLGTYLVDEEAGVIEIADGIADSIYVLAGSIVVMGGTLYQGWFDLGRGMTWSYHQDNIRSDTKEKRLLEISLTFSSKLLRTCQSIESYNENGNDSIKLCQELIADCVDLADVFNIPVKEVFDEVHKSNMSKVWPDGTVKLYKRGPKKGKVKKPDNYKAPDIEKVLKKKKK